MVGNNLQHILGYDMWFMQQKIPILENCNVGDGDQSGSSIWVLGLGSIRLGN